MKMSEKINELVTALSKAQAGFEKVTADKEGYGYTYADLASLLKAVRKPLSENGLAITQLIDSDEQQRVFVTTLLLHSSGQYMQARSQVSEAVLSGNAGKNPVQRKGAAITYERRYALAAMLGIAQEDDDAACCGPEPQQKNNQQQRKPRQQRPQKQQQKKPQQKPAIKFVSPAMIKQIKTALEATGLDMTKKPEYLARVNGWLKNAGQPGVTDLSALTVEVGSALYKALCKTAAKKPKAQAEPDQPEEAEQPSEPEQQEQPGEAEPAQPEQEATQTNEVNENDEHGQS